MANKSSLAADIDVFWWTIPLTLLQLTFNMIGLMSSIVFISIVVTRHELWQNLALLLAVNLSIGGLIFCFPMIVQNFYMLTNSEPDRFCPLRGYLYVTGLVYTFQATTLQTVHRLCVTVFVHYRQLQNRWLFLFIALVQFSISVGALLPLLFSGHFSYLPDGKVCYIAFVFVLATLITNSSWKTPPYAIHLSLTGISVATGMGMLASAVLNKQVWEIICSTLRCVMMRRPQNSVHVMTQQNPVQFITQQQHLGVHQTTRM
jgi:hypothetical protein